MVNLLRRNCRRILSVCFALILSLSIITSVANADEYTQDDNAQVETLQELLKEVVKNRGITTSEETDGVTCFLNVIVTLGDELALCENDIGCQLQALLKGLGNIFNCASGGGNDDDDGGGDGDGGGGGSGSGGGGGGGGGSGSGGGEGGGSGSGSGGGGGSGSGSL
ncbi:MAG: hypothetical protein ACUZ8E_04455 [Candidatus Anammoxibacter sp.]